MTTIIWADFPPVKDSVRGYSTGYDVGVFFSPTYAEKYKRVGRIAQKIVTIGAITGIFLLGMEMDVFAAGLDEKAKEVFKKLLWLAKWIIAIKGGTDILNKLLQEDFPGMKKSGINYLIGYGVIIALPLGLDAVESFFDGY